jgi:hypothetical protein
MHGVTVGVGVTVDVLNATGVSVPVGVPVGVPVPAAVPVLVGEGVPVAVGVRVAVAVTVTVEVAVLVLVAVAVLVGVLVEVAVAVLVLVGVRVGVAVLVGSGPTRVVALDVLFSGVVSVVSLAAMARFGIVVPFGVPASSCTVMVNVAEEPAPRLGIPQWTTPTPPAPGSVQKKAGPAFCSTETHVVSGGVTSMRAAFAASAVPPLVTARV